MWSDLYRSPVSLILSVNLDYFLEYLIRSLVNTDRVDFLMQLIVSQKICMGEEQSLGACHFQLCLNSTNSIIVKELVQLLKCKHIDCRHEGKESYT